MNYDNELSGVLFKNDNQREGKQDPNAKGSATIGGVEYWVSAWTNTTKDGKKYQRLKFKAKEQQPAAAPKAEDLKAPAPPLEFDDEIPF